MTSAQMRVVAVVGAGPVAIAFVRRCLAAGLHVVLEDVLPANLRSASAKLASPAAAVFPARLQTVLTVEDAVREADLAIDFVPDELESKLEIVSMIDRMAPPRTVLCTPTETLSITDLASCTYRPERCFALHGLAAALAAASGDSPIADSPVPSSSTPSPPLRLSYPPAADPAIRAALEQLLATLHLSATAHPDPVDSQLTRGL